MSSKIKTQVNSEVGELEAVLLHTPGNEIENMTPADAERALYSDILNLSVARREYDQFSAILDKVCTTFQVKDLMVDVLGNPKVRENLILDICRNEGADAVRDDLINMENKELASALIEGVVMTKDNLSKFLDRDIYALQPLHNFFFTRDAAVAIHDRVLIGRMKSAVREREAIIMEAIFDYSSRLLTDTFNPAHCEDCGVPVTIEGGDVLVVRDDILCIGIGPRTSSQGVDFLIDHFRHQTDKSQHIIVQELPGSPESFIHLDMTFTMLDHGSCMVYEPLILKPNKYQTVHIHIEGGKVKSIHAEKNIPDVLGKLGMEVQPILCGGTDSWNQQREQWHSGANFFALAPGKVMGYERNVYTIEEMDRHGFSILKAIDVISGKVSLDDYAKYVVTIEGSELSRGGGGCRCMSMPVRRK